MASSEITWVATLVASEKLAGLRALGAAFQWDVLVDKPDQLMFRDAGGCVIEYCTVAHEMPEYLFANQTVVIGFLVSDIDGQLEALPAPYARPVGNRTKTDQITYQHVSQQDGTVFGLVAMSPF